MKLFNRILMSAAILVSFQSLADQNKFSFSTSPVKLGQVISTEMQGAPINYNELTSIGKINYKNDLIHMDSGKWNHLKGSRNVFIATNSKNEVGIVKVQYSFSNFETSERYRRSLAEKYPEFKNDILRKGRILIEYKDKQDINYTTMHSYINSIIDSAKKELSSDRLRYQNKKLFIEINQNGESSVETYIDLKVSPQSKDFRQEYISNLNNVIEMMELQLKEIPHDDLHSKEYMENQIKSNNIHIF